VPAAIRDATVEDARAIAQVHVRSWRWAYRGQIPDEFLARLSIAERESTWRERLGSGEGPRCVVAEANDGAVVGFASFGEPQDGVPPGTGELLALYLEEDVVGTGVGRRLLARASERLRDDGWNRAFLWVLASNDRARRFYERAGWSWDGTTSEHRFDCANRPMLRYVTEFGSDLEERSGRSLNGGRRSR
jgi:GNAT superfamily N-acetyltransferase